VVNKESKEKINMQNFEQLVKIYNTLALVSTKGEDTIVMGQCLNALKEILIDMQKNAAQENINVSE
jgi:hypothetical protein